MEGFVNEYVLNPQVWPALVVFVPIALIIFSYFYNRLMDQLNGAREHLSLYVVGGVLVTLLGVGIFSWKAALLAGGCFVLSGPFMIWGEFRRTAERRGKQTVKAPRRKRLPYAANGFIADAKDAADQAKRLLKTAMKNNGENVPTALAIAEAQQELSIVVDKLVELKLIQLGDE